MRRRPHAATKGGPALDDPTLLYERASEFAAQVFSNLKPDQHDDPTPCTDWDVRALMNHIVGGNHMFALSARGQATPDPEAKHPDLLGGDPAAAYRASVRAVKEAFAQPGAMERVVNLPAGEMPGAAVLGIAFTEQLIHGWDLAKATGQDSSLDPELAAVADAMIRPNVDFARDGGFYGPEVDAGSGASPGDRVVALTGRAP